MFFCITIRKHFGTMVTWTIQDSNTVLARIWAYTHVAVLDGSLWGFFYPVNTVGFIYWVMHVAHLQQYNFTASCLATIQHIMYFLIA